MWCMHCGQDVPWTASAKDGRLVCSRCGLSPEADKAEHREDFSLENLISSKSEGSGHVPLNLPINDLHGAHSSRVSNSGSSVPSSKIPPTPDKSGIERHDWPISSAYDGWDLDEQLSHIRQVLDSISDSASSADVDSMLDAEVSNKAFSKNGLRFDAMHQEKEGRHRRPSKREPLMGRLVFGLVFLMLGTGILVLSIALILPREIWFPADVPITGVLMQVFGAFLVGLGLSAQLRRFQAALHVEEPDRQYRRFDEPQLYNQSPHVDAKIRS